MAKDWCTAPSNPLVRQIADKYNVTRRKALTILNNARGADPLCRDDNMPLESLERQQGFKDAIDRYVTDYVTTDDILFSDTEYRKKVKDAKDELETELGITLSVNEVEDLLGRAATINSEIRLGKITSHEIKELMRAFKNTSRLNFIGDFVARSISRTLFDVSSDAQLRNSRGIAAAGSDRDYLMQNSVKNLVRSDIRRALREAAESCAAKGRQTLADELKAADEHLDTLIYMYGSALMREKGVSVVLDGRTCDFLPARGDSPSESGNDDTNSSTDSTNPTTDYTTAEDEKPAKSKVSGQIKTLLATLTDGDDPYGYGLPTGFNVSRGINELLTICRGCSSYAEMVQRLRDRQSRSNWIPSILATLDGSDGLLPASMLEVYRTLFYESFHKSFITNRKTFLWRKRMMNITTNSRNVYDRLYRGLNGKLNAMSGAEMFDGGKVSSARLEKILSEAPVLKDLDAPYMTALAKMRRPRDYQDAGPADETAALDRIADRCRKTLKAIGIDADSSTMESCLTQESEVETLFDNSRRKEFVDFGLRYKNIYSLIGWIHGTISRLQEWAASDYEEYGERPDINPLIRDERVAVRYPDGEYTARYRTAAALTGLLSFVTANSFDSKEITTWDNGKMKYAETNPVTAEETIGRLTASNVVKRQGYIERKYCRDSLWFLRQGSDADSPKFYSHWLQQMYDGSYSDGTVGLWQKFKPEYSEKSSVFGHSYNGMNSRDTLLSMVLDYFMPSDGRDVRARGVANFRMLIASDKPRYATVRFRKSSEKEVLSQAEDFMAQEITRAMDVVSHAAHQNGDPSVDNYDITVKESPKTAAEKAIKDVIGKVRDGRHVSIGDVLYEDKDEPGKKKYAFRNTGASFFLNKFLNDEIESGSALGTAIVERIFNQNEHRGENTVTEDMLSGLRDAFRRWTDRVVDRLFARMDSAGLFEETAEDAGAYYRKSFGDYYDELVGEDYGEGGLVLTSKWLSSLEDFLVPDLTAERNGHKLDDVKKEIDERYAARYKEAHGDADASPLLRTMAMMKLALYEFVQNNWMAKANMSEIFNGDLAFYGTTTNFQKRNAEVLATGQSPDPDATVHGERVSDGSYRSITVRLDGLKSQILPNLRVLFDKQAARIADPDRLAAFRRDTGAVLAGLESFDGTDGQALTTPTGLRKRLAGIGRWSRSEREEDDERGYVMQDGKRKYIMTDEAVYRRFRRGDSIPEDFLHRFGAPMKPFVSAFTHMRRRGRGDSGTITVPVQYKNSEHALTYLWSYAAASAPGSPLEALFRFVEESVRTDPATGKDRLDGIDVVNFDTAQKIGGNSEAVDLTGLDAGQVYDRLNEAVYGETRLKKPEDRAYRNGAVTVYDVPSYKIVQQKTEHYRDSWQQIGSQIKILAVANLDDSAECTLPDGTTVTGKELKKRYFDALRAKTGSTVRQFRRKFGLDMPRSARISRLSNMLSRAMGSDTRSDSDMKASLSVTVRNGVDQFAVPLDDAGLQGYVESMLLSQIRDVFYRQKTAGGIVVQASSWGKSDGLSVRFRSSNPEDAKRGGVVPTLAEYLSESPGATEESYSAYLEKWQGGYAWFECETPMPQYIRDRLDKATGGRYTRDFFNADGTWNMERVREAARLTDRDLEVIAYRIPTENKYSAMVGRVVRFSAEGNDVCKFPTELTYFTGSDFDIDTDTIERRPDPDEPDAATDNEIFDLQAAALTSPASTQETFHSGDFSDLKNLSYRITLLRNGWTEGQLSGMTDKEIKDRCMEAEDLDLMDPTTDDILHEQNSDAKSMIAIAASSAVSHSFFTLFNSVDRSDPSRNPDIHPENFLRIRLGKGDTFVVVNDKDGEGGTVSRTFTGYVPVDMVHDMDGNIISLEMKYVGASADAAKDAALYRLNINSLTLPVLIMAHRLGVSSDVARLFISQPIIRKLVGQARLDGRKGLSASYIEQFADDFISGLAQRDKGKFGKLAERGALDGLTPTLRRSALLASASRDPESAEYGADEAVDDWQMLNVLHTLVQLGNRMADLDSFTRYNSSKTMGGSSFLMRYVRRRKLLKLESSLSGGDKAAISLPKDIPISGEFAPDETGRLFSMFPHIAATVIGESELVSELITENMHTYDTAFFGLADRVMDRLDGKGLADEEREAVLQRLYAGYKHYLLFYGASPVADFNDRKTFMFYTRDFWKHYSVEKERMMRDPELAALWNANSFLKSLYVGNRVEGTSLQPVEVMAMGVEDEVREKFKSDWAALIGDPRTRKLAVDIAIHFLARNSAFSPTTAVHMMPLAVKRAIPRYFDTLDNASKNPLPDWMADDFLAMFQMNSSDDRNLFPYVRAADCALKDGKLLLDSVRFRRVIEAGGFGMPVIKVGYRNGSAMYVRIRPDARFVSLRRDTAGDDGGGDIEEQMSRMLFDTAIEAEEVQPLGVADKMQEYSAQSLAEGSAFAEDDGGQDGAAPDETAGSATMAADRSEDFSGGHAGTRSGTFISSSPYGDEEFGTAAYDKMLAREPSATYKSNPYLESRTFLKRASKIASALGFELTSTREGSPAKSGSLYSYSMSLSSTSPEGSTHENAMKAAAVISVLGYRNAAPTVRTYTDITEANKLEVSIPISLSRKDSLIDDVRKLAGKRGIDCAVNFGEARITVERDLDVKDGEDVADGIRLVQSAIDELRGFNADLRAAGISASDDMEVNWVREDTLSDGDKTKILDSIIDGQPEKNKLPAPGEKALGEYGRPDTRAPQRLKDYAGLAKRKLQGEEVSGEIRDAFGERRQPLMSTASSVESRSLADRVLQSLDDGIREELYGTAESSAAAASSDTQSLVDNLIIRTANWLVGSLPNDPLAEAFGRSGFSAESAGKIMDEIQRQLDKENIC